MLQTSVLYFLWLCTYMLIHCFFTLLTSHVYVQMIELYVLTPPRVQLSMTISNRPVPLTSVISNGQSLRITCATWGNPRPSISWFKNGVLHVQSGRHHYTNKNTSRTFASEDLFIGMIMFNDMVCSNYLIMPKDNTDMTVIIICTCPGHYELVGSKDHVLASYFRAL